jgi:hypothetical protein
MITLALLLIALPADAHKPAFGDYSSIDDPYFVEDPSISMVLYHEVTCESDQVWLQFNAEAGSDLYMQLGVPQLERLEDYQPSLALIAPGLPALDDVPFDVPEGYGGYVFTAEDTPTPFYEPFTQTSSWIWVEETIALEISGEAYVVGFHPGAQTGKIWVALGTVEDFSDVGIDEFSTWGIEVGDFHETQGERQITEEVCVDNTLDPTQDTPAAETGSAGCSHLAATTGIGWAGFLTLGLVATMRREQHLVPVRVKS